MRNNPLGLLVGMLAAGSAHPQPYPADLRYEAHLSTVPTSSTAFALSSDGKWFAVGGEDGAVRVWAVEERRQPAIFPVLSQAVKALAFDPDNHLLVGGVSTMMALDLKTKVASVIAGTWNRVAAIAASREKIAWATDRGNTVEVRSRGTGAVERTFSGHSSPVQGLAFNPDGLRLAAGEFFRVTRLWNLDTPCVQQNVPNRSSSLHGLNFSQDGRWLAAVSDSSVQISDPISGQEMVRFLPHDGAFVAASFTSNGSVVAVTNSSGLQLWRSPPLPFVVAKRPARPVLHIVVVGINSYRDPTLQLGYAQQDASELAAILEQNPGALAYEPRATRILGSCAGKSEILAVLSQLAHDARPDDSVLIFLAGHGRIEDNQFYYYTYDYSGGGDLPGNALAATEIAAALEAIPARRQVLILDACQSGSATAEIHDAVLRAAPPGRSVQILSASAASEEAMEAEEYSHGILTHVLLERLDTRLKSGESETVEGWLSYARRTVPRVARQFNKSVSQEPSLKNFGNDFPLLTARTHPQPSVASSVPLTFQNAPSPPFEAGLSCVPTAADKTFIRPEGLTELIGDIVFRCSGKPGITSLKVQIFFNTAVTGKFAADGLSDTTLLMEAPGTRSGLLRSDGKRSFAGRISGNSIQWSSVPLPSPTADGIVDIQVRITGIRVNAAMLGLASTTELPTPVQTAYQIETPNQKLPQQTQTVAYIAGPLAPSLTACGGATSLSPFDSSANVNGRLATSTSHEGDIQYRVQFREAYPEHFLPAAGKRSLRDGLTLFAESPNQGTRLMLRIDNIPSGVSIFATLAGLPHSSSPTAKARMIVKTDARGSGGIMLEKGDAVGLCEEQSLSVARLPIEGSVATLVWEVTGSDPNEIETFSFGLMVSYQSNPGMNLPAPGTATAVAGYAPLSTTASAGGSASASEPVPRFAPSSVSTIRNLFTIQPPTTRLLFPDLSNQGGMDSGIRIVNGSGAPGSCILVFGGSTPAGAPPLPLVSPAITNGSPFSLILSGTAPGFHGCVLATCQFKSASGEYATVPIGSTSVPLLPAPIVPAGADPKTIGKQCSF